MERAFAEFQDELYGMLWYLLGSPEEARAALEETYRRCWRHRRSAEESVVVRSWVFRVGLIVARHIRRRRRRTATAAPPPIFSLGRLWGNRPDDPQHRGALRRLLGELREHEQEVFFLRQNGHLTYEEIAQATGLPLATVRSRMRLVLRKLRESLETSAP